MTKTKENQDEIIFSDDIETRTYFRLSHERDLRFIQMKMYNHSLSAQCSLTYNDANRIVQFLTKQLQFNENKNRKMPEYQTEDNELKRVEANE
jgi:hypothetical protein